MTWVPPVYRQPGEVPPPRHRAVLPVAGAVATAASIALAGFLTEVFSFFHSVCNEPPAVVASQRDRLRVDVIVIWVLCAGGPIVVAGLARMRQRSPMPWVIAAVVMIGVGLVIALTIRPGTFCLF